MRLIRPVSRVKPLISNAGSVNSQNSSTVPSTVRRGHQADAARRQAPEEHQLEQNDREWQCGSGLLAQHGQSGKTAVARYSFHDPRSRPQAKAASAAR